MKINLEFDSMDELRTFWDQFPKILGKFAGDSTLSKSLSAQVIDKQEGSTKATTAATSAASSATPVEKQETSAEITADTIRELTKEKAGAGHRDAIRSWLDEHGHKGGATSTPAALWPDYVTFLNSLA